MATINLGRIKPVNKGVWSNSTAYAVDDFVQYTDNGIVSTYIAVATSTNQAPSTSGTENSTYWKFMAKGVASELTGLGNNKIVVTNSSGNATGLSIGTAGQSLKVNSGANGFEFGTIQSDFVKLASQTLDSTGLAIVEFQNCFSSANDSLYGGYQVIVFSQNNGANDGLNVRYMYGTNTEIGGSNDYTRAGVEGYRQTNNQSNGDSPTTDGDGRNSMDWENWGQNGGNDATEGQLSVAYFQGGMYRNDICRNVVVNSSMRDASAPNYVIGKFSTYRYHGTQNITGLKFYVNNGAMSNGSITLWGMKK